MFCFGDVMKMYVWWSIIISRSKKNIFVVTYFLWSEHCSLEW